MYELLKIIPEAYLFYGLSGKFPVKVKNAINPDKM